jgi:hypothetical protein
MPGGYIDSPPQDKENFNPQTRKSAMSNGSGSGEKKRVTLGLAIAGVSPQQAHSKRFETSVDADSDVLSLLTAKDHARASFGTERQLVQQSL